MDSAEGLHFSTLGNLSESISLVQYYLFAINIATPELSVSTLNDFTLLRRVKASETERRIK